MLFLRRLNFINTGLWLVNFATHLIQNQNTSDEFIKYLNIKFCHNLHAQSVKAMRFPRRSYHDALSAEERRQREQEDMELAKEMVDEDDDMFWFFNA